MIDIAEGPGRDLKNIRQIGTPAEGDRIYIENAAYSRVHEETYEERRVFIFMGHTECEQGVYMTFVEAAIPVRDMEFSQNLPRWGTLTLQSFVPASALSTDNTCRLEDI